MSDYVTQSTQNVSVRALLADKEIYFNYPRWQRSEVWTHNKQVRLIRTLLDGGYIHPIVMFPSTTSGDPRLWVLDGRQRFSTLLSFLRGGFGIRGKQRGFIDQLTEQEQTQIRGFTFNLAILNETDEARLKQIYRSLQNLTPLTASEKLYSYIDSSKAADFAEYITTHRFFKEVYVGGTLHMEDYQMALYPMGIELYDGFVDLSTDAALLRMATGSKDDLMTPELLARIDQNLETVVRLFNGSQLKAKIGLIMLYQAVYLLQIAGMNLDHASDGCLTPWLEEVTKSRDLHRYDSDLLHVYKYNFQHNFWFNSLLTLSVQPGLPTTLRSEMMIQRMISWIHRRHICPACQQATSIEDVASHAFLLGDQCKNPSLEPNNVFVAIAATA